MVYTTGCLKGPFQNQTLKNQTFFVSTPTFALLQFSLSDSETLPMSSGSSNTLRVFRGCRSLLAPNKSTSSAATTSSSGTSAKTKINPKPKEKVKATGSTPSSTFPASKFNSRREPTQPTGIMKATQLSPALGNFLGVPEASRADAVKKIWSYIKLHNLQNPVDRKQIQCDERLKTIFDGKEKVGFLEISKLLTPHFVKAN